MLGVTLQSPGQDTWGYDLILSLLESQGEYAAAAPGRGADRDESTMRLHDLARDAEADAAS
jgi:hypothetical protein